MAIFQGGVINSVIYLSFELCYGQSHSRIENVLITERFFDNHYKSTDYADFTDIDKDSCSAVMQTWK